MSYQSKVLDRPFVRSRLDTLAHFGIMDTPPEPGFDDLVALAAQICGTPISAISLIDDERQWFKAQVGLACHETPLLRSLCADTLDQPGLLVIRDLAKDARSRHNPAVSGDPFLRFYARVRLEIAGSEPFGTLCVIDYQARPDGLSREQATALEALARQVISQLELRKAVEEQERTTAALRTSEARMRAVFETNYQLQGFAASDGTLLDANAPSLEAIRCRRIDVIGQTFWNTPWFTATPGMSGRIEADVGVVLNGGRVRREIELQLPGERRIFDFSMRPVWDDTRRIVGLVYEAVDLTDRRRAESHLRQSQKMEAVGQLTGGIAHDFNNMLAIVVGFLDLARRKVGLGTDAAVLKYLDNAAEGANRAIALTRRLLAFSRQQQLEPQVAQPHRLVENIAELLRRTLTETILVATATGDDLWSVNVDVAQLENALINLAVNGRDAMPGGGTLTITAKNVAVAATCSAAHSEIAAGDYVIISVTDTGSGMAPDVVERAFEPFFTTKSVGRGSGLGLSQVIGFVQQSGGHVKLRSTLGQGTTVCLYLPRFGAPVDETNEMPLVEGAAMHPAEDLVLVVEDEEKVREMTVEALEELGYAVIATGSPGDALRQLRSNAAITLLFTDVVMPEMSGCQLAQQATADKPNLKVLFTTGCARDADQHLLLLEQGAALLPKPFTIGQLASRIRLALA